MPLETLSPPASARRVASTSPASASASSSLSPENVAAAQDGSRTAQSLLAEAIRPLIERQLSRYPLTEEDRHDVLQSTQMQVIRRLSSFRGNSSFTTWLFRVTANEALMLMRSQRRLRARVTAGVDLDDLSLPAEAVTAAGDLTSSMLDSEREGSVRSAVAQLPEHYQAVVAAHYVDDLGLQEIALRLSLTESAVRSRLHRARARLRDLLGDVVSEELRESGRSLDVSDAALAASPVVSRSLVALSLTAMRAAYFRHGHVETTGDLNAVRAVLEDPDAVIWIDLPADPSEEVRAFLSRDLGVHLLVIEDLYAQYLLPKTEDFDDYLYVLLHCLRSEEETKELTITELDLLLSNRWLVTHALDAGTASCTVDKVFREVLRQRRLWEKGAPWLFHAVIDRVVDEYLPVTEAYDQEIEELEAIVLDGTADNVAVERMFGIKRSLVKLRRLTVHQRDIFQKLARKEFAVIPDALLPFMRDVYDHFARNVDLAESYRDLTSNVLEMHLSMQSFRMNEVMKLLTMLSTVMLPLTLVAGIYGMNFEHMPELKWKYGYPAALGLMATTALGMVLYFRKKKWL